MFQMLPVLLSFLTAIISLQNNVATWETVSYSLNAQFSGTYEECSVAVDKFFLKYGHSGTRLYIKHLQGCLERARSRSVTVIYWWFESLLKELFTKFNIISFQFNHARIHSFIFATLLEKKFISRSHKNQTLCPNFYMFLWSNSINTP